MPLRRKSKNRSIFLDQNVQWIFAGHCTGFDGCCLLKQRVGSRFQKITTGMTITLIFIDKPGISFPALSVRDEFRTLYA